MWCYIQGVCADLFALFLCDCITVCVLCQSVGVVQPHTKLTVSVQLLPLALGIHKLSGFALECKEMQSLTYNYDNIHQILVKAKDHGS